MELLENSYAHLPEHFFAPVQPARVPVPDLIAWNASLARELNLDDSGKSRQELAHLFSGNELPPGSVPIATAYAGHQFGHFTPQLGDGRAILLGEAQDQNGKIFEVQLKGAGRTPFSRGGDGKSWIGPVIREYLLSEAMHHLGVPTTRALAAVRSGETVYRDGAMPGGVFTRVAASHIRVGTFQYFAARGDQAGVRALAHYAAARHYPATLQSENPYRAFFTAVVATQAELLAHWMRIGFIHGVMNTDNTAISGETIDYGPCAFMDEYDANKVFSSIDRNGRYAYSQQPLIAKWNLARLAECLLIIDDSQEEYEDSLATFSSRYEARFAQHLGSKFGLAEPHPDDAALFEQFFDYLQANELDFTVSFRTLAERVDGAGRDRFGSFESLWRDRLVQEAADTDTVRTRMNNANPLFVPRNHQVERAIAAAIDNDMSVFEQLCAVIRQPYSEQPEHAEFAQPPLPSERVRATFCGT